MKRIYAIAICILALAAVAQQDPQYNLYQFNQMVINPAYAGARDGISAIAAVRNQWAGFDGAPRTTCASVHAPIMNKNVGVGLTVVQDAMGPRKTFGIYGNGAYILKLGKSYKLSFGLSAGYSRYQFDFSKLNFKNPETNTDIYNNFTKGALDMNTGLFLRSNKFFVGLSFTHITGPSLFDYSTSGSELQYRLVPHAFFTIGRSFEINENVIFAPTFMLKSAGTGSADLNFNFFLFKKAWLGVFYRGGYGPGFLMQYYITNQFKVAYSFDSGAKDARKLGASHEVMIGFDLRQNKSKVVSPRFL
jgi:type IX secretion system PorP/SprF family membrane protein